MPLALSFPEEPQRPGRLWAVKGPPAVTNVHQRSPLDRRSGGYADAPSQVPDSDLHFLRNKKQEWEEYRSEVTAFELKALLPVL
ncbi:glutamine synthetase [Streptomyces sp. P8-A8]